MKLPIVFLIPSLLVISSLFSSFMVYHVANSTAEQSIRLETISRLKLDITRLQNILYNLLPENEDNIERARVNLSVTAMDPAIRTILVTDTRHEVILANRYLWENHAANEVTLYNSEVATKVRTSNNPAVFFDGEDDEHLFGYFPVVLKLESEKGLPVKRTGVLFTEVLISSDLANAQSAAFVKSLIFSLLMMLASIAAAIILHIQVSRRLKGLAHTADQFSTGDRMVNFPDDGKDELSYLGRSFNDMARRIRLEFDRREDAENELRELNENLEQRVAERTSELEKNKQLLIDSQARSFHSNKLAALGEMASGIAHEINSPIQAISLLTYKLKKEIVGKCDISYVDKIDSAVDKISHIIDSLRKVSRDSSTDPFEKVTIKEIIDDVLGITSERYNLKNIQLECNYHDGTENYSLSCQRLQVGQIIINLLNNSYDAVLQAERKWISVNVSETENDIVVSICDSGAGIPSEIKSRVFEPMFTTKDIGKGTGLGLSISSEIAKQHHGSLTIDPDSSDTCFILKLPK